MSYDDVKVMNAAQKAFEDKCKEGLTDDDIEEMKELTELGFDLSACRKGIREPLINVFQASCETASIGNRFLSGKMSKRDNT